METHQPPASAGMRNPFAPGFGVTGEKLETLAGYLAETVDETASDLSTTRAAVLCAFLGVVANLLARIDRGCTAELFAALSAALRNGPASHEVDSRRISRAAVALFEAEAANAAGGA